jgi:hypothetical protein
MSAQAAKSFTRPRVQPLPRQLHPLSWGGGVNRTSMRAML